MSDSLKKTFICTYHVSPGLLTFFLIFILSTLTYLDLGNHQFINYDDGRIILSRIDTFDGLTIKNIRNIILDDYPREEPLVVRDLSYLINGSIFGALNPQGFVLGNLLLHMLASYLVFALSLVLFPERYWQAITCAVLFAIHPVHVESVAWISSRKDTLYSCFFLAGFLRYNHFILTNRFFSLATSFGLYILALFSKSSAIAFVPIVLLFRCLVTPQKKWTRREAFYFILLTLASFLFMGWYSRVLTDFGLFKLQTAPSLFKVNPANWLILNLEAITFYLGKLLYPKPLSIIYDYPDPNLLFSDIPFLVLSLGIGTILFFSLLKLYTIKDKRPLFLVLWFLVVLGPYLNWAGINIFAADRYLYLAAFAPLAALSYLLTAIVTKLRERHDAAGNLAVVLLCLLCSFMIIRGIKANQVWSTSITLWQNALEVAPAHIQPYDFLMQLDIDTYSQDPNSLAGKEALARAITVANTGYRNFCQKNNCIPEATGILYNIALIYYHMDNLTKSEQFLRQGLLLKPEDVSLNYMHTFLAIKQGDYQAAQEDIELIKRHANPLTHANILAEINDKLTPLVSEKLKVK